MPAPSPRSTAMMAPSASSTTAVSWYPCLAHAATVSVAASDATAAGMRWVGKVPAQHAAVPIHVPIEIVSTFNAAFMADLRPYLSPTSTCSIFSELRRPRGPDRLVYQFVSPPSPSPHV